MNGAGLNSPVELAYTDYAKLQQQYANAQNTPENLTKAARHFESVFIDMWMQSAREANQVFAEDNFLNGPYMDMSQQMLDREMSVHLSNNGGIGLAEVIVRQMSGGQLNAQPSMDRLPMVASRSVQAPQNHTSEVRLPDPHIQNNKIEPDAQTQFTGPQSFVDQMLPVIQQALRGVGLSATTLLSQAALETGWGQHVMRRTDGQSSHNLFGMKASKGDTDTVQVMTKEFEHGRWLNKEAVFRSYDSWTDSVQDYVQKITQHQRYSSAIDVADDPVAYSQALQDAGYATDPDYAAKIQVIVQRVTSMLAGGD